MPTRQTVRRNKAATPSPAPATTLDTRAAAPPSPALATTLDTRAAAPPPDGATTIDGAEREHLIALVAYDRAQARGFAPGHELEDWLCAEREIDRELGGVPH